MSKNIYKGPTLLRVGERSARDRKYAKDEYVLAQPGTIVAPRPKGEKPTLENAARAVLKQAQETLPGAQVGAAIGGIPSLATALRGRGVKQPAGLPKVADTMPEAPRATQPQVQPINWLTRMPTLGRGGGPQERRPGLPAINEIKARLAAPQVPPATDPEGQRQAIIDRFTAIIQLVEQVNPALAQRLGEIQSRTLAGFTAGG